MENFFSFSLVRIHWHWHTLARPIKPLIRLLPPREANRNRHPQFSVLSTRTTISHQAQLLPALLRLSKHEQTCEHPRYTNTPTDVSECTTIVKPAMDTDPAGPPLHARDLLFHSKLGFDFTGGRQSRASVQEWEASYPYGLTTATTHSLLPSSPIPCWWQYMLTEEPSLNPLPWQTMRLWGNR